MAAATGSCCDGIWPGKGGNAGIPGKPGKGGMPNCAAICAIWFICAKSGIPLAPSGIGGIADMFGKGSAGFAAAFGRAAAPDGFSADSMAEISTGAVVGCGG